MGLRRIRRQSARRRWTAGRQPLPPTLPGAPDRARWVRDGLELGITESYQFFGALPPVPTAGDGPCAGSARFSAHDCGPGNPGVGQSAGVLE